MKIRVIRLRNLNSLRGVFELDFESAPLAHTGLFAITGDTGAGKTTLLDAITLALFGRTSRDHESEVMSNGTMEALAEVEFDNENGIFLARWQQKRTNRKDNPLTTSRELAQRQPDGTWQTITSKKSEVDSSSLRKGAIEQYLGLNYDQFKRTVLLAQGEFAAFLLSDEKNRSAVLERLTNTEIYTRLSKAAHIRSGEEKQTLQQLQARREELQLLDPAQTAILLQNRTQLETDIAALTVDAERLRANRDWILRTQALQAQQAALEVDARVLSDDQDKFAHQAQQLSQHVLALPFRTNILLIQNSQEEYQALQREQADLKIAFEAADAAYILAQQTIAEKRAALSAAQVQESAQNLVIEQVIRIDDQIETQFSLYQSALKNTSEYAANTSTLQENLHLKQLTQTANLAALELTQIWLHEHTHLQPLHDLLLTANDRYLDRLRGLYKDQVKLQTEQASKKASLQDTKKQFEQQQQQTALKTQHLQSLHTAWQQLLHEAAPIFSPNNNILPKATNSLGNPTQQTENSDQAPSPHGEGWGGAGNPTQQVENQYRVPLPWGGVRGGLSTQRQSLETFLLHTRDYRATLYEMGEVRDKQDNLRAAARHLLGLLDETAYDLQEAQKRAKIKQSRFELNQILHERAKLQAGEPCPLCGSTEHPFAAHDLSDFEADARIEWELAQKRVNELSEARVRLEQELRELSRDLRELESDFEDTLDDQTTALVGRVVQHEVQLNDAGLTVFDGLEMQPTMREELLLQKIAEIRAVEMQATDFINRATALEQQIQDAQLQVLSAQKDLEQVTGQLAIAESLLTGVAQQLAESDAEMDLEKQNFDHLFAPFNLQFEPTSAFKTAYDALREQAALFSQKQADIDLFNQKNTVLEAEIQLLADQLNSRQVELQQLKTDLQATESACNQLKTQRNQLFGTNDPQATRAALRQQVQINQDALMLAQEQEQLSRDQRMALHENIASLEKRIAENQTRQNTQAVALLQQLKGTAFEDTAAVQAAFLSDEQAAAMEAIQRELTHRATTLAAQLSTHKDDWARASQLVFDYQDLDTLQPKMEATEAQLQDIQREIGGITQQISANAQRMLTAQSLIEQMNNQTLEYERWENLRNLIGAADGAVFRRFAQSLTLVQLVHHANRHLAQLQGGRYRLRKRPLSDLDLEIVDTFQADHIRSVSTLSGGETFLTSLALALGLADMTGRKTRIRSLFIDEGFGALDETALEIAVTTLENLQAQGTTIGVISHIREMKERIATQIQVIKQSDGFSRLEIK